MPALQANLAGLSTFAFFQLVKELTELRYFLLGENIDTSQLAVPFVGPGRVLQNRHEEILLFLVTSQKSVRVQNCIVKIVVVGFVFYLIFH